MNSHTRMLLPVLAFAAIGATSVYLFRQLQSADDTTRGDVVRAPVLQATPLRASHETAAPQFVAQGSASSVGAAAARPAAVSRAPAVQGASSVEAVATSTPMARLGQALSGVMNDPNMRQMIGAGQRLGVRMAYGELTKELRLTQEQANQFYQVLIDGQAKVFERLRNAGGDPAAFASATSDVKVETDAAMMTLLGSEKFLVYEEYQKSVPERMEVSRLGRQLSAANAPLSDSQRKTLLSAMIEERALVPPPRNQTPGRLPPGTAEQQQWQSDYDTRVRERAARILTEDQLKQFEQMQSQQSAVRNMMGALMPRPGSFQSPQQSGSASLQ